MQSAAELIMKLQEVNAAIAELTAIQQLAERELMELLEAKGERTASVSTGDGQQISATVVRAERTVIDEDQLARAVGWHFAEIADLKLNRGKMEKAVRDGKLDFKLVAKFTTIKESKPYIRYSVMQEDGE